MRTTTLICLIFLPFVALQAQDDIGEEEPEIRRYTVEMIIFKYAQEVAPGTEIFLADRPIVEDPGLDDGLSLPRKDSREEIPRRMRDIELARLPATAYTMRDILGHLKRLDVYDPVMHFGWTQITWPEEETRAIDLGSMGRLPRGLDGSLKLYLSRFLHLVVDLQLDAPQSAKRMSGPDDPTSGYGDYRTRNGLRDIDEAGPIRYRINENRIFRSGELRYFDHPKFGVLAKVTRVEEKEQESAELDTTELLGDPAE